MSKTSWSPVAKWYTNIVGEGGHYFHEHVIFPRLKALVDPRPGEAVIDVGCGQGVYARQLTHGVNYVGVDISKELITEAKKMDLLAQAGKNGKHSYYVADATKGLPVSADSFDHAVALLALQNMRDAVSAIQNIATTLRVGGDFVLVINHPSFRIPRQSSWGVDEKNKLEYRRINRYLTPLEIPINAHPSLKDSPLTWSYHAPLEYYFKAMKAAGLVVTDLEEWTSDKKSVGKAAKGENRARAEFPLFLAIKAVKIKV